MRKRPLFLLVLLILINNSCDILNPEKANLLSLDSKIIFQVEDFCWINGAKKPGLSIDMETAKEYPCCNYWIETEDLMHDNTIHINIFGVYEPNGCATAFGPARQSLVFGQLDGKYLLNFRYSRRVDQYELWVTDTLISLTPKISRFTEPEYYKLWKRPENSFAVLCGTTVEDRSLFQGFLDTLRTVIAIEEFSFPETGRLSYPSRVSGHYYNHPVRFFRYQKDRDFYLIEPVLKAFKSDHFNETGNSISIINWENEKIHSWLL